MAQPQAQKQPSWWQRIFTTAPRGQYAVDEKQQNVKEKEFIIMRWNLAIYRNKYLNMFLNEHLTTVKVMPVDLTLKVRLIGMAQSSVDHSPPTVDRHLLPHFCRHLWPLCRMAGSIPFDSLCFAFSAGQLSDEEGGG